jgi:pyridoxine/pyridoxamine 5'-phosphate oxidase
MSSRGRGSLTDMDAKNLASLYDLPTLEWAPFEEKLVAGYSQAPASGGPNRHSTWIATVDADGSPHVNGIGSLWLDGAFIFETARTSRKGRNLERDPRCTISLALEDFDIVVEGEAQLVTDPAVVADVAARYRAEGWPAQVDESGTALTAEFSAPSAGPPPWHVYRMVPQTATVLSVVEPGGATRFRF